jgi:hypothetical protein
VPSWTSPTDDDGAPERRLLDFATDLTVVRQRRQRHDHPPADDPAAGDAATLYIEPITDTLGPALTYYDPVSTSSRSTPPRPPR